MSLSLPVVSANSVNGSSSLPSAAPTAQFGPAAIADRTNSAQLRGASDQQPAQPSDLSLQATLLSPVEEAPLSSEIVIRLDGFDSFIRLLGSHFHWGPASKIFTAVAADHRSRIKNGDNINYREGVIDEMRTRIHALPEQQSSGDDYMYEGSKGTAFDNLNKFTHKDPVFYSSYKSRLEYASRPPVYVPSVQPPRAPAASVRREMSAASNNYGTPAPRSAPFDQSAQALDPFYLQGQATNSRASLRPSASAYGRHLPVSSDFATATLDRAQGPDAFSRASAPHYAGAYRASRQLQTTAVLPSTKPESGSDSEDQVPARLSSGRSGRSHHSSKSTGGSEHRSSAALPQLRPETVASRRAGSSAYATTSTPDRIDDLQQRFFSELEQLKGEYLTARQIQQVKLAFEKSRNGL